MAFVLLDFLLYVYVLIIFVLSLSPFSFGHCISCPSIYGFWLPLWYLQSLLISTLWLSAGKSKLKLFVTSKYIIEYLINMSFRTGIGNIISMTKPCYYSIAHSRVVVPTRIYLSSSIFNAISYFFFHISSWRNIYIPLYLYIYDLLVISSRHINTMSLHHQEVISYVINLIILDHNVIYLIYTLFIWHSRHRFCMLRSEQIWLDCADNDVFTRWDVVVRFVDIGRIVDYYYLRFIFTVDISHIALMILN